MFTAAKQMEDQFMRVAPGMRTGYGMDKKDSNELSLFNDFLAKSSVLRFSHD